MKDLFVEYFGKTTDGKYRVCLASYPFWNVVEDFYFDDLSDALYARDSWRSLLSGDQIEEPIYITRFCKMRGIWSEKITHNCTGEIMIFHINGVKFQVTQDMKSGPPWVRLRVTYLNGESHETSFEPYEFKIFADSMKSIAENYVQQDMSR